MRYLSDATLQGKTVLLRFSADVPLSDGKEKVVTDDRRLRQVLPTIHFLLEHDAKIVLIGHLGRPGGKPDPALSLRPVYLRLSALLRRPIGFAPSLFSPAVAHAVQSLQNGQIFGLENLRFDPGEEKNSRTFAQKLARYAEVYVDEAFSNAHRAHASMAAITEFLPSYAGLQFEKEYHVLTSLLRHPAAPFVLMVGGAKVSDKLPLIKKLLGKVDRVLVGGEVANTFLAAQGVDVKKSLVETDLLAETKVILNRAAGKIILPTDYRWSDDQIRDIGPQTVADFAKYIHSAKTIFWNGDMGLAEDARFRASDELARLLTESPATTIIGGGNTAEIFDRLDISDKVSFISSGGGATLSLLGGETLPAVAALN